MSTQPTPSRRTSRRLAGRRGWRVAGVGLVASLMPVTGLTAGALVLPGQTASATAAVSSPTAGVALADWTDGSSSQGLLPGTTDQVPGGGDSSTSPGSSSQGSTTSTVDSDPATTAQSVGVVLVDTVLGYSSGAGAGTGIVLTTNGQVLTNYHVVEGATSIKVTIASTGRSYTADVVGHSESGDIALLQLEDASGLATATVDDDTVTTGDDVSAVGNAGGTGQLTAADGTVTALEETITTADESSVQGETLNGLIETDADVVAGDSGGPLIDDEGEVVGIDTAASSGSVIDGYAIPIDDALAIVRQIRTGEDTSSVEVGAVGFLGVQLLSSASADNGYGYGYGYDNGYGYDQQDTALSSSGASVADVVADSPAAQAGLTAGDTITAIGGTTVTSADQASTLLGSHDAGDAVTLQWTDSTGADHEADVTLAASPVA